MGERFGHLLLVMTNTIACLRPIFKDRHTEKYIFLVLRANENVRGRQIQSASLIFYSIDLLFYQCINIDFVIPDIFL